MKRVIYSKKTVALILFLLILVVFAEGCDDTKTVDGHVLVGHYGLYEPAENFCPDCDNYELSKFCKECGTRQPEYAVNRYCLGCEKFTFSEYCKTCGKKATFKKRKRI